MTSGTPFSALLDDHRRAFGRRQQWGVHFVAAATLVWVLVTAAQVVVPGAGAKNLATFVAAAVLMPLAWLISKLRGIPFQDPSPLARLGLLISVAQALYLPIAMWVYSAVPHRFVMVLAVITTAHLLPFAWLYDRRAYLIGAVAGTVAVFAVGILAAPAITAAVTAGAFFALTVALLLGLRGRG